MLSDISESVPVARRRDLSFYIVLFFFVGPIWAVVPLSWAYAVYSIYNGRFLSYQLSDRLWLVCALAEVSRPTVSFGTN